MGIGDGVDHGPQCDDGDNRNEADGIAPPGEQGDAQHRQDDRKAGIEQPDGCVAQQGVLGEQMRIAVDTTSTPGITGSNGVEKKSPPPLTVTPMATTRSSTSARRSLPARTSDALIVLIVPRSHRKTSATNGRHRSGYGCRRGRNYTRQSGHRRARRRMRRAAASTPSRGRPERISIGIERGTPLLSVLRLTTPTVA